MKAILVIDDMPKNCMECKYCGWSARDEEKRACMLLEGWFFNDEDIEENRSVICPLKPLPTRPDVIPIKEKEAYVFGWNDCLKEIEGD